MNRKIETNNYKNLLERYKNGESVTTLSKDYKVHYETMRKILRKMGPSKTKSGQKYDFNRKFFQKINSEETAYFLGLMYSDGNIHNHQIRISLADPDSYLLEKFRNLLSYIKPLVLIKKRKPFHKQKYLLELSSTEMVSDLKKLGCIPRKSLILEFPTEEQVPAHLMNHFLRGVFDGDGSIYTSLKNNNMTASITSSPFFCESLSKYLENIGIKSYINSYKYSNAKDIRMSVRMSVLFLDYLYSNSNIKMSRKFNKFIYYLENASKYSLKHAGGSAVSNEKVSEIKSKWLDKKLYETSPALNLN